MTGESTSGVTDSNFPHMTPRKDVVFNYFTLVSDDLIGYKGQLSEVNLDPDALVDMVSIMVNKHVYKTSPRTQRCELDLEEVGC